MKHLHSASFVRELSSSLCSVFEDIPSELMFFFLASGRVCYRPRVMERRSWSSLHMQTNPHSLSTVRQKNRVGVLVLVPSFTLHHPCLRPRPHHSRDVRKRDTLLHAKWFRTPAFFGSMVFRNNDITDFPHAHCWSLWFWNHVTETAATTGLHRISTPGRHPPIKRGVYSSIWHHART